MSRTRDLYQKIRAWAESRDDVTIIGGWAVYERVEKGHAMQSRDVDIVLHSEAALKDLLEMVPKWDLRWRTQGRKRFPDAHFADEDPLAFRLDIFTTESNATWTSRFGRQGAGNIKQVPRKLIPDTLWLIQDKLATLPKRRVKDAMDKQAKDLIDIYNLLFHNVDGTTPGPVRNRVSDDACAVAAEVLARVEEAYAHYQEPFEVLSDWLAPD